MRPSTLARFVTTAMLGILFATEAAAHDPGVSTLTIRPGHSATVTMELSRAELASLFDVRGDDHVALRALAKHAIRVESDGRLLVAGDVDTAFIDATSARITWHYEGWSEQAAVTSEILARLARGHRQLASIERGGIIAGERLLDRRNATISVDDATTRADGFVAFVTLGVEHILIGYDHLLFLLTLLIVGGTLRSALGIITAFTVAHSITLALAAAGGLSLPGHVVEPLIALSVVFVAVENLVQRRRPNRPGRWRAAFAFGLVHGFGFAGVLGDLGLVTADRIAVPLLSFNLGVELGQVAVAVVAWPLIRAMHRAATHRPVALHAVHSVSAVAAVVGVVWFVERTI